MQRMPNGTHMYKGYTIAKNHSRSAANGKAVVVIFLPNGMHWTFPGWLNVTSLAAAKDIIDQEIASTTSP